jgi:hypothetical protein
VEEAREREVPETSEEVVMPGSITAAQSEFKSCCYIDGLATPLFFAIIFAASEISLFCVSYSYPYSYSL